MHVENDGSLKNQPNYDTTALSHHLHILYHFDNYANHKTLYMQVAYSYALMNKVFCSFAHSTVLHIKGDPYCHVLPHRPSIAHALHSFCIVKTDHIWYAQYSNYRYIAATHNITLFMHIKMHYTPTTIHCNFNLSIWVSGEGTCYTHGQLIL